VLNTFTALSYQEKSLYHLAFREYQYISLKAFLANLQQVYRTVKQESLANAKVNA